MATTIHLPATNSQSEMQVSFALLSQSTTFNNLKAAIIIHLFMEGG